MTNPPPDKSQNFLNEIEKVEKRIANNGNDQFAKTFTPHLYEPLKTYWLETLEGKGSKEIKDQFRKWVIENVDISQQVSDELVNEYRRKQKLQPELGIELLIEYRDWYVNLLADTYLPVTYWYHNFWDETTQTLNDADQLETELFSFCLRINKPFVVGLRLLRNVYAYYRAISCFNKLMQAQSPPAPPKKEKPAPTPDELRPTIFIPSEMQKRLFNSLSNHTPIEQHENLQMLLEQGKSEHRIWVKLSASPFAIIFKQARESHDYAIKADMTDTAKWLAAYFNVGENSPKQAAYTTMYGVLRGNKKPAETKKRQRL